MKNKKRNHPNKLQTENKKKKKLLIVTMTK